MQLLTPKTKPYNGISTNGRDVMVSEETENVIETVLQ